MQFKREHTTIHPLLLLCAIVAIVAGMVFIIFYPQHLAKLELDANRAAESRQIEEAFRIHGKSRE